MEWFTRVAHKVRGAPSFQLASLNSDGRVTLAAHAQTIRLLLLHLDIGALHDGATVLVVSDLHVARLHLALCVVLGNFLRRGPFLHHLVLRLCSASSDQRYGTCNQQTQQSSFH